MNGEFCSDESGVIPSSRGRIIGSLFQLMPSGIGGSARIRIMPPVYPDLLLSAITGDQTCHSRARYWAAIETSSFRARRCPGLSADAEHTKTNCLASWVVLTRVVLTRSNGIQAGIDSVTTRFSSGWGFEKQFSVGSSKIPLQEPAIKTGNVIHR